MSALPWEIRALPAWNDPVTPASERRSSGAFRATWPATLSMLADEANRIGHTGPVVIGLVGVEGQIRRDGMLYADAKVAFPGAVVFLASRFGPLRMATDAYEQTWAGTLEGWKANVRAIALTLAALRDLDRWGVSKRGEQYTGWQAIEAPRDGHFTGAEDAEAWMRAYALDALRYDGSAVSAKTLYRAMARRMHPDTGWPRADWDRLDEARRLLSKAGRL